MRGFATLIGIACSLAVTAPEAWAAEARAGRSGLAVGIFLAFCGLIVVAQLLPALRSRLLARRQSTAMETVKAGDEH